MELKAYRTGGSALYWPRLNGNRDLPLTERIECELLPMSNAEREAFGARLVAGGVRREDMIQSTVSAITDTLSARVISIRNLSIAGQPITNGVALCGIKAQFNSPDLAALIEELLQALQDFSTLEPGLLKNSPSSRSI